MAIRINRTLALPALGNEADMSTFDTLCDWKDGLINDTRAIGELLLNLSFWCPETRECESFQGLCKVWRKMSARKGCKDIERLLYQDGCYQPNYPLPAIHRIVDIYPEEVVIWKSCNQTVRDDQDYRTYLIEINY